MLSRFNRYPGSKILGFGAIPKMQKRHYYPGYQTDLLISMGLWAGIFASPFFATYLAYKSYKYFHNNYEIVKKNKMDDENTNSNEKNVTEEYQSTRRPGGI
jgi:hypothetical protein